MPTRIFESSGTKLRLLLLFNFIISAFYIAIYGLSIIDLVIILIMYFMFMCIGLVCTFHRYYSHKSFNFKNKFIEYVCTTLGLLSGTGSVFGWCGVHNKHHDKHDTSEDPHDPNKGLIKLLTLDYNYNIESKYIRNLFRNKFLMFTHKYYYLLILIYIVVLVLIFGATAPVAAFCIPSLLSVVAQGMTTYFLHKDGKPQLVRWMNIFVFGDGNHNEHHENIKKYKLKYGDIAGWIIEKFLMK